jgi:hypothetical protein
MREAEAKLVDAVTVSILSQCQDCDIHNDELVIMNRTSCSTSVNGAAVFRGVITSTAAQTMLLFCELQKWQQAGPLINLAVDQTLFSQVDRTCSLMSKSLNGPECSVRRINNDDVLVGYSFGAVLFLLIVTLSAIAGTVGTQIHRR